MAIGNGPAAAWVGSLRFRLAGVVAIFVLVGMAVTIAASYALEYRSRRRTVLASLMEQAHSLLAARGKIESPGEYAEFVDEFCARMNSLISPGHHILVLGPEGSVLADSREHSGMEVQGALLAADPEEAIVPMAGRRLAQVRLATPEGGTVVVAQYLEHMEAVLRQEMMTWASSITLIGLLLILLLVTAIRAWVLRPVDELRHAGQAWSQRDFKARAGQSGPRDMRVLAGEFNQLASELECHEARRVAEMAKAREIQAGFLPGEVPEIAGLAEVVACYEPAEDVAGDLYDIINLADGRTAIVVLDVSGHGVSAALLTGITKMALHWRLTETTDLPAVMGKLNGDLVRCLADDQFVTLVVGVWSPDERTWSYCAAGHPGGMLQGGGEVEELPSTGPLLGVVKDAAWEMRSVRIESGERIWLYTDGLVEAGIPDRQLGIAGISEVLRNTAGRSLKEQATGLVEAGMARQRPGRVDDVTVVGVECQNGRA